MKENKQLKILIILFIISAIILLAGLTGRGITLKIIGNFVFIKPVNNVLSGIRNIVAATSNLVAITKQKIALENENAKLKDNISYLEERIKLLQGSNNMLSGGSVVKELEGTNSVTGFLLSRGHGSIRWRYPMIDGCW